MNQSTIRRGFTIIELVVSIAVIGILIGLLLPAVQSVRASATKLQCQNNLRQIALGCQNYESRKGYFPSSNASYPIPGVTNRGAHFPWTVILLPELGFEATFQISAAERYKTPTYLNPPHEGLTTVIKNFVCPSDSRLFKPLADDDGYVAAYCSYVGIMTYQKIDSHVGSPIQQRGIMNLRHSLYGERGTSPSEISDGLSNTIHFGESPPYGQWLRSAWYIGELPFEELHTTRPCRDLIVLDVNPLQNVNICRGPFPFSPGWIENPCDSHHLWSLHPGGGNFAMADGSIRFLSYTAHQLIPALASIAGGEVINE